jgi:prepilin-type N-terminal cleavage/methylation domain-containing protein/prepilin-type processing-associated H-X9-DG protein
MRLRRGFTLIELLVVIAIIAILAAILFPVFAQTREKGRQTSCLSNMKQLGLGFAAYLADYDGVFPGRAGGVDNNNAFNTLPVTNAPSPWGHWTCGQVVATANPCRVEQGGIYPYVKNTQVFICPSDVNGRTKRLSYSFRNVLGAAQETTVVTPSNSVMLVDESATLNDGNYSPYSFSAGFTNNADGSAGLQDQPTFIHNGGTVLLFVDGHAKWFLPRSIPYCRSIWYNDGNPRLPCRD